MFSVSTAARQALHDYFLDKKPHPMRVFLKKTSCGGPRLVLGIDELTSTDMIFSFEGLTYGIDRVFFEKIKPVRIDFINNAFQISASLEPGGCAGCRSAADCDP
jgi:Fe-S cluster assembly iron-binding protein IscA